MTSTVARLACAAGMEDPGRVADDAGRRPDPEVPERARRRTFTAKYKLEVLADYDAAPEGRRVRCCAVRGCIPAISCSGAKPATPVRWRAGRPRGRKRRDAQAEQIARLQGEKQRLEQELAKTRAVVDVQAKLHALLEILRERGYRAEVEGR